ncbi:MAG: hypothetical protein EXS36_16845 [Pedosphaera sp.]|nr:hypothetical protein [Pedosphaera sp.]
MGRFAARIYFDAFEHGLKLVGFMTLVVLLITATPFDATRLAVVPRTVGGLTGVLIGPMVHANVLHLAVVALPLFALLSISFWSRRHRTGPMLGMLWLATGASAWLVGPTGGHHLGASALVTAFVGYLMTGAWITGRRQVFLGAVVCGGLAMVAWILLPQPTLLWAELLGYPIGGVAALLNRGRLKARAVPI